MGGAGHDQHPGPGARSRTPTIYWPTGSSNCCGRWRRWSKLRSGNGPQAREYERYLGSSVKGEAAIDWADRQARTALLAKIVADADRLLELSRQAQGELPEDGEERQRIVAAAELLGQLLLQDVERAEGGVSLKDGVSRDRMMSVHDPEMRHGHKSSSRRFDGHKAVLRSWSCPISCTRHSASFCVSIRYFFQCGKLRRETFPSALWGLSTLYCLRQDSVDS